MNLLTEATVSYCEKASGLVIKRPFYAFSNLGYILAGFLILRDRNKLAYLFGSTALLVGIASFVYDSQPLLLTQLVDIFMMIIFSTLLLALNLIKIYPKIKVKYLYLIPLISIILVYLFGGSAGRIIFGVILVGVIASELYLIKLKRRKHPSIWAKALLIFVIAFAIWMFDATKVFCFDGILAFLNGRSVYHYLSALSVFYLYKYYAKQGYKL